MFAYQKTKFQPDIITTAKGITSGYSQLGAVIVNDKLSSIYNDLPILTGLTYFGHSLPCTIANNCLDLYLKNDRKIINLGSDKGEFIKQLSKTVIKDCDIVKEYRNNGLLGCFEIHLKKDNILEEINRDFLESGIYCYMRENRIFIAPPLITDYTNIETTIFKIKDILEKYND